MQNAFSYHARRKNSVEDYGTRCEHVSFSAFIISNYLKLMF